MVLPNDLWDVGGVEGDVSESLNSENEVLEPGECVVELAEV